MTYSNSFKIICLFAFLFVSQGCNTLVFTCGDDVILAEYPFLGKTWEDHNLDSYTETIYYKDRFDNEIKLEGEVLGPDFKTEEDPIEPNACWEEAWNHSYNHNLLAYWNMHYSLDFFVRYEIDIVNEVLLDVKLSS